MPSIRAVCGHACSAGSVVLCPASSALRMTSLISLRASTRRPALRKSPLGSITEKQPPTAQKGDRSPFTGRLGARTVGSRQAVTLTALPPLLDGRLAPASSPSVAAARSREERFRYLSLDERVTLALTVLRPQCDANVMPGSHRKRYSSVQPGARHHQHNSGDEPARVVIPVASTGVPSTPPRAPKRRSLTMEWTEPFRPVLLDLWIESVRRDCTPGR